MEGVLQIDKDGMGENDDTTFEEEAEEEEEE